MVAPNEDNFFREPKYSVTISGDWMLTGYIGGLLSMEL